MSIVYESNNRIKEWQSSFWMKLVIRTRSDVRAENKVVYEWITKKS